MEEGGGGMVTLPQHAGEWTLGFRMARKQALLTGYPPDAVTGQQPSFSS